MSARPALAVITGTVGRPAEFQKMLDSVMRDAAPLATDANYGDIEVVVAAGVHSPLDNPDEAIAGISLFEPGVHVLVETRLGGWVRAMNAAAAYARGEALLWLNDDAVIAPGTLRACIDFAREHPNDLGAVPWRDPGQKQYAVQHHLGLPYANFGCVSRSLFFRLGGFDTRYTTYAADTDFSFEVWKAGGWVLAVPEPARIDHARHPGGVRGLSEMCAERDGAEFRRKWPAAPSRKVAAQGVIGG